MDVLDTKAEDQQAEQTTSSTDGLVDALAPPRGWRKIFALFTHRISGKIIIPYLVLVLILAVFATYVVMNLVTTSLEEKFRSQLADAGRSVNEAMVKIETDHLKIFRNMAFTQGVAERLKEEDGQQLQSLLGPIQVNAQVDYIDVFDVKGDLLLVLRPPERAAEAANLVDQNARQWPPVQKVLERREDRLGDKFSAVVATSWGPVLYTAGPVKLGDEFVGVIAVGTPLEKVVAKLSQEAVVGITVYAPDGSVFASTIPGAAEVMKIDASLYERLLGAGAEVLQRTVSVGVSRYQEMLGVLEVRREPAHLMGVSQSVSLIAAKGSETRDQMIGMFSVVIFLVVVTSLTLARKLTRPIIILVEACKALASGDLSKDVPVTAKDEIGLLMVTFNQTLQGLRERDRAKDAFGRYMSSELYEAIQKGELKLGGETREITIIMSDIRGFTTLSETLAPADLVAYLNRYFENQVAAIQRYGGTVDKFMGDAILAKFGAPVWYPDHARRAVLAMLEMRKALDDFNHENAELGVQQIRIGIGSNSGPVVVGNIGAQSRMEYTIIGDAVNATQRIEDLCKEFKWDLLISDMTYNDCKNLVDVGEPHRITLRGRQQETLVYPLIGLKEGVKPQPQDMAHSAAPAGSANGAVSGEREPAPARAGA